MADTVSIVTGGNQRVGYETAKAIASVGGIRIIGCRDLGRGQQAANRINEEFKCDLVFCLQFDIGNVKLRLKMTLLMSN